jgi:hypothetical protein
MRTDFPGDFTDPLDARFATPTKKTMTRPARAGSW